MKTNRKRKLVSPSVLAACKKSKNLHWRLKNFKGAEADRGLLLQQRKTAKKELRRTQRAEKAANRHKIYLDIMTANSDDKQLFFRLVKMQREGKVRKLSKLIVNDVHLQEDDKIREGWAVYFTNLSTAKSDPNFDQEYQQLVDRDIINLTKLAAQEKDSAIEINIENLQDNINKMKSRKVRMEMVSWQNISNMAGHYSSNFYKNSLAKSLKKGKYQNSLKTESSHQYIRNRTNPSGTQTHIAESL